MLTEEAKAEATIILDVKNNLISPKTNICEPIVAGTEKPFASHSP